MTRRAGRQTDGQIVTRKKGAGCSGHAWHPHLPAMQCESSWWHTSVRIPARAPSCVQRVSEHPEEVRPACALAHGLSVCLSTPQVRDVEEAPQFPLLAAKPAQPAGSQRGAATSSVLQEVASKAAGAPSGTPGGFSCRKRGGLGPPRRIMVLGSRVWVVGPSAHHEWAAVHFAMGTSLGFGPTGRILILWLKRALQPSVDHGQFAAK
jgi:hypothetical protein